MEFMEGGQVNDRAYMERNGIDVNEVTSSYPPLKLGTEGVVERWEW